MTDQKQQKTGESVKGRYVESVGRRKTAVARIRLMKGKGSIVVNEKKANDYFPIERLQAILRSPLSKLNIQDQVDVSAKVLGGGTSAQAEAIRHGIARALVMYNPETKIQLHAFGFLTRDSRMVERKKYGLKKARRAPQWAKR
ncbi:MAG: 30S ribosomal protein S9 [Patescibacteria group bacterium]|nr:30S ribosomal protein S9 [Patescibacteria group bacterium]